MPRETVAEKADRYLLERRVAVVHLSERGVRAIAHGDTQSYDVTLVNGTWHCTCPARRRCAHVTAVDNITCEPKYHRPP